MFSVPNTKSEETEDYINWIFKWIEKWMRDHNPRLRKLTASTVFLVAVSLPTL